MPISFDNEKNIFTIDTENTKYVFQIVFDNFPVHLYYGKKENAHYKEYTSKIESFAPFYSRYGLDYLPDVCMAEYVGFDSGDYRTSSLKIKNSNGDSVTSLKYKRYCIFKGRLNLKGLPFADSDDDTETLQITMLDEVTNITVELYYTVFPSEDIISRYVKIINNGKNPAVIEKCMSLLLDLPDHNYDMISLYGAINNERNFQRNPLFFGNQSVFSRRGASSHQFNPFIALCSKEATQEKGNVYGFNFVFSGSFLDEVEVDQTGKTRVQIGLGSENFSWLLDSGEDFVSPEAVMTFSSEGIGKMSRNFHDFIRNHILPPEPFSQRPVVLNTWEACYFDIDESIMLKFAESAAEVGIDMLVMDDGWFGTRNNDKQGLGDWYANKEKFKDGLKPFIDKIKGYGLKFGIWIEPEMVNLNSELFRAHPEWCLQCRDREMMESRNQLVLDFGNAEVINHLKNQFEATFSELEIDYFKWDMNRHISQAGSLVLPTERQGEAAYRYMLGVYEFYDWFKKAFPNAMLENCSGGGGRYDLGMMKYSTMIWTSDCTLPERRMKIQYSSLLAYPATTMSCHVSNHEACKDLRNLNYRWQVAMGGALGYELNLPLASDDAKNTIKQQIKKYREYEKLIFEGDYYSIFSPFDSNYSVYCYTNKSKDRLLLTFLQNDNEQPQELIIPLNMVDNNCVYLDQISNMKYTGRLLREGIKIMTENAASNSNMWYFKKIM